MHWQYILYFSPIIIITIVVIAVVPIAWQYRHGPRAKTLLLLMLALLEWSLGNFFELRSSSLQAKLFWANIEYIGIVAVPVLWFIFALQCAGYNKWLTRRNLILLILIPVITLALVLTNGFHGLMRQDMKLSNIGQISIVSKTYGAWFWVHTVYSYVLYFMGILSLIKSKMNASRTYRSQLNILIFGALIPLIGNVLYVFKLSPISHVDLTPYAFAISSLIIVGGPFHFHMLNVVPIARDAVIENMHDGVIVLDPQNCIIDLNPAAGRILHSIIELTNSEVLTQPISRVLSARPDLIETCRHAKEPQEIEFVIDKEQRHYDLRISPFYDSYSRFTGHIAILHEITKQKKAELALIESKKKIEGLHEIACQFNSCKTEDEVYKLTVYATEELLDFPICRLDIFEDDKLVTKAMSYQLSHLGEEEVFESERRMPIEDIGVLQIFSDKSDEFTEDDLRLLELLLGHTLEAVKRISLQNNLEEQAIHDPLTGLYNRRYFMQLIKDEFKGSKEYKDSIAFLMIDINLFKEVNDRFGHQVGDRVLWEMGALLKAQLRENDIVVRYGGDEFLVILLQVEDAEVVVQRIRRAVNKWNEENSFIDFPITLGIGVSYWEPKKGLSIETVLNKADKNMYKDKKQQEAII